MSERYLLPCRCGQQITVEPRQAGETVVCGCGQQLQVPRLREVMALEPAPAESAPPPSAAVWGWRQMIRLIGVILLAASLVIGGVLFLNRPVSQSQRRSPEQLKRYAHKLTPLETWGHWEWAKKGVDRRVDLQYARKMTSFRIWLGATAALGLIGAGLIITSVAWKRAT